MNKKYLLLTLLLSFQMFSQQIYMKKLTKIASIALLAAFLAVPVLALGQVGTPPEIPEGTETSIEGGDSIIELLRTFLSWVAIIFWIFAVGFILYAGFLYLTAGGDTNKITLAAGQFKYGVIAIVIGLLAYGLPKIISNILSEL